MGFFVPAFSSFLRLWGGLDEVEPEGPRRFGLV